VLSPDYTKYMDIQHAINLRLHRDFTRLGIEFAYPAQNLFVRQMEQPRRAA
jgi:small-conductance mechanosensitive channel